MGIFGFSNHMLKDFIPNLIGIGGDSNGGANFRAEAASIDKGYNPQQITDQYERTYNALNQQNNFVAALQGQHGIQNQNSVFQQQQGLANQFQNVANGTGPNPAMAQLANTTGQNVATQAALMAGQRGASANAGLLGRQIGMQGGAINQQAGGQAALMGAQQQLAALGQLQQQQGMMGQLAGQQVNQQGSGIAGYNQFAQNEQQNLLNSLSQYNNANVNMQSNQNDANTRIQGGIASTQAGIFGAGAAALGGGSGLFKAHGGMIEPQSYAGGGFVSLDGPQSHVTPMFEMFGTPVGSNTPSNSSAFTAPSRGDLGDSSQGPNQLMSQIQQKGVDVAGNAVSKKLFSSGAGEAGAGAAAGSTIGPALLGDAPLIAAASKGGMLNNSGQRTVPGDSLQNDTIPAMLSPHEIVIPRSITLSPNAPEKARDFVAAVLARNGMLGSKKK